MKDIKKPDFMKAALTARSHHAVLELFIAVIVFLVADIVMGILQVPALVVYLLGNKEYMSMIMSNSIDFERIMEIMSQLPDWMTVFTLLLEAGLIVVFILYCRLFEKRKPATMGFQKKGFIKEYSKGIIIGAAAFMAVYGICVLTGSIEFSTVSGKGTTGFYLIAFLFGYLVQGMAEEVICRGYLMVSLSRRYSVSVSLILSAIFFSMLHGMNAGIGFLAFLNLFLFGCFMGLLFIRCENIWVVGAVHSIWNFMQGNIFGIQVSGLKQQPSLFTTEFVKGREFINGGSFGAEGGLAVTLVLLSALAILLWNMSKKGFFVKAEQVYNPYDQQVGMGQNQQSSPYQNPYGGQNQQSNPYQNPYGGQNQQSNPYQNLYGGQNQQNGSYQNPYNGQTDEKHYENMGMNPTETPWHPQKEEAEHNMTDFNQNYFKD